VRVLISGGGTSGHVNPGLAVARILAAEGNEVQYVGTASGPESTLVARAGIPFHTIDVIGRERGLSLRNLKAVAKLGGALWRSIGIVARVSPNVILGTGGYVSLPVVIAGWIHRIPIVLHEQNAVLGLANRLGARFARYIAVSFPETAPQAGDKGRLTGNPLRLEIVELNRESIRSEALSEFGFEPGRKTLLVMGGSQGAANINRAALDCYDVWRGDERLQVLQIAGPKNFDSVLEEVDEVRRDSDRLIWRVLGYADRMELVYSIADLALCRSGATTVAELAAVGIPAIFVPWPHALDDDQLKNAMSVTAAGGGQVVLDRDLSADRIVETIGELIFDDERLSAMSTKIRSRSIAEADRRLAELIEEAAAEGPTPQPTARVRIKGLSGIRRLHLVGIGGAGMSALAHLFTEAGITVTGSDRKSSSTLDSLKKAGLKVEVGHGPGRVAGADAVVASSAVRDDNVELLEAKSAGIPIWSRGEAVAKVVSGLKVIAIAGTHGKTTASAMALSILEIAGLDPMGIVGGPIVGLGSGGRLGAGEWAVVEADEAFGSFLLLDPEVAAVTNIDEDHLDFYGGIEGLEAGFKEFVHKARRRVIACLDDERADRLTQGIPDRLTYGFFEQADVRAVEVQSDALGSSFRLLIQGEVAGLINGEDAGIVRLSVGGRHTVLNALCAAACGLAAGIGAPEIVEGLERFRGVGRRFERRGALNGAELRDDYAHHPKELQATLAAAQTGSWTRVIAVFQPHLYSRTRALWRELGTELTAADVVVVTDVDGAREDPVHGITGKMVADAASEAAPGKRVVYLPNLPEVARFLKGEAREGDLVLTLGCGFINQLHDLLLSK
jgi:UDP-N-acetylmuramate--alanine ligase